MRDDPVVRSVPSKKQNSLPGHLRPEKASECWGAIPRGRLLLPPLKDELVAFGGVLPRNVQDHPPGELADIRILYTPGEGSQFPLLDKGVKRRTGAPYYFLTPGGVACKATIYGQRSGLNVSRTF